MKAMTYRRYGEPGEILEFGDIDPPAIQDDQVLVRVRALSIQPLDWHLMTGTPYIVRPQLGLFRPKRDKPGADLAGTVEAVGRSVTRFQVGDEVFGETVGGACAELVAAPEGTLVHKPGNVSFEQAAAVPVAGLTALQGLRDSGKIRSGHEVLVIGASGGVGTFAVQIAKALGAQVTAVCSTRNVDQARAIGADHVIDYTMDDFLREERRYDLILDIAGTRGLFELGRVLQPEGRYVVIGSPKGRWIRPLPRMFGVMMVSRIIGKKMVLGREEANRADLEVLGELLESGKVTPVIDRTYPLIDTVDAVSYLAEGHARGKIVVSV